MGNHHEKLALRSFSCPSIFTNPDTADSTPDSVSNHTDSRSSNLDQTSHTPDLCYPLIFSRSFPSSLQISLSRLELYYQCRVERLVIPLYLSMPWSDLNTKYKHTPSTSIYQVQHTPSTTAFTQDLSAKCNLVTGSLQECLRGCGV